MGEMKKFDIVKLKVDYSVNNLVKNDYGLIMKVGAPKSLVLFFNKYIIGDYALAEINNYDLKVCDEKVPNKIVAEFIEKGEIEKLISPKHTKLKDVKFKENDFVKLIADKDKYKEHGVFCGDTGFVVAKYAIKNQILVDFTGVDDNFEVFGDCIVVDMDDLEAVES